jgi:hypothetical protein
MRLAYNVVYALAFAMLVTATSPSVNADRVAVEWGHQQLDGTFGAGNSVSVGLSGGVFVAGNGFDVSGTNKLYLSKYDTAGNFIWKRYDRGANFTKAKAVTSNSLGDSFVAGLTDEGYADGFVAKYDDLGNEQWSARLGASGYDRFTGVAADSLGNVFVAGSTDGNVARQSFGSWDALIAKYDTNGSLVWSKQFGTGLPDYVHAIDIDGAGNVFVTGSTHGSLFAPNARGGSNQSYFSDTFVAKFDSDGALVWSRQYGDSFGDMGTGITLDASGNIFVSGHTQGSRGGAPGGDDDVFIDKLDSAGNRQWVAQFGTADRDWSNAIATDKTGAVFVTSTNFSVKRSGPNDWDALVRKFSPDGQLIWHFDLATTTHDHTGGISVGSDGEIYVVGETIGSLFGPNAIGQNGFLMKLLEVPEVKSLTLLLVGLPLGVARIRKRY